VVLLRCGVGYFIIAYTADMKKRVVITVVTIILPIFLVWAIQRGWSDLFNWLSPFGARILTYVIIAIAVILICYIWWNKIILQLPVLQVFWRKEKVILRVERKGQWRPLMKYYPDSFVFPYVRIVDISTILLGRNYLSVQLCYSSALHYDLILNKPLVRLVLNGDTTKKQPLFKEATGNLKINKIDYIKIFSESCDGTVLPIFLSKVMRNKILEYKQQQSRVKVYLELYGYDEKEKEYHLSTREWETFLYYKLNGSKD